MKNFVDCEDPRRMESDVGKTYGKYYIRPFEANRYLNKLQKTNSQMDFYQNYSQHNKTLYYNDAFKTVGSSHNVHDGAFEKGYLQRPDDKTDILEHPIHNSNVKLGMSAGMPYLVYLSPSKKGIHMDSSNFNMSECKKKTSSSYCVVPFLYVPKSTSKVTLGTDKNIKKSQIVIDPKFQKYEGENGSKLYREIVKNARYKRMMERINPNGKISAEGNLPPIAYHEQKACPRRPEHFSKKYDNSEINFSQDLEECSTITDSIEIVEEEIEEEEIIFESESTENALVPLENYGNQQSKNDLAPPPRYVVPVYYVPKTQTSNPFELPRTPPNMNYDPNPRVPKPSGHIFQNNGPQPYFQQPQQQQLANKFPQNYSTNQLNYYIRTPQGNVMKPFMQHVDSYYKNATPKVTKNAVNYAKSTYSTQLNDPRYSYHKEPTAATYVDDRNWPQQYYYRESLRNEQQKFNAAGTSYRQNLENISSDSSDNQAPIAPRYTEQHVVNTRRYSPAISRTAPIRIPMHYDQGQNQIYSNPPPSTYKQFVDASSSQQSHYSSRPPNITQKPHNINIPRRSGDISQNPSKFEKLLNSSGEKLIRTVDPLNDPMEYEEDRSEFTQVTQVKPSTPNQQQVSSRRISTSSTVSNKVTTGTLMTRLQSFQTRKIAKNEIQDRLPEEKKEGKQEKSHSSPASSKLESKSSATPKPSKIPKAVSRPKTAPSSLAHQKTLSRIIEKQKYKVADKKISVNSTYFENCGTTIDQVNSESKGTTMQSSTSTAATITITPNTISTLTETTSTTPNTASTLTETISTTPNATSTLTETISITPDTTSTLTETISTTPNATSTLTETISITPDTTSTVTATISATGLSKRSSKSVENKISNKSGPKENNLSKSTISESASTESKRARCDINFIMEKIKEFQKTLDKHKTSSSPYRSPTGSFSKPSNIIPRRSEKSEHLMYPEQKLIFRVTASQRTMNAVKEDKTIKNSSHSLVTKEENDIKVDDQNQPLPLKYKYDNQKQEVSREISQRVISLNKMESASREISQRVLELTRRQSVSARVSRKVSNNDQKQSILSENSQRVNTVEQKQPILPAIRQRGINFDQEQRLSPEVSQQVTNLNQHQPLLPENSQKVISIDQGQILLQEISKHVIEFDQKQPVALEASQRISDVDQKQEISQKPIDSNQKQPVSPRTSQRRINVDLKQSLLREINQKLLDFDRNQLASSKTSQKGITVDQKHSSMREISQKNIDFNQNPSVSLRTSQRVIDVEQKQPLLSQMRQRAINLDQQQQLSPEVSQKVTDFDQQQPLLPITSQKENDQKPLSSEIQQRVIKQQLMLPEVTQTVIDFDQQEPVALPVINQRISNDDLRQPLFFQIIKKTPEVNPKRSIISQKSINVDERPITSSEICQRVVTVDEKQPEELQDPNKVIIQVHKRQPTKDKPSKKGNKKIDEKNKTDLSKPSCSKNTVRNPSKKFVEMRYERVGEGSSSSLSDSTIHRRPSPVRTSRASSPIVCNLQDVISQTTETVKEQKSSCKSKMVSTGKTVKCCKTEGILKNKNGTRPISSPLFSENPTDEKDNSQKHAKENETATTSSKHNNKQKAKLKKRARSSTSKQVRQAPETLVQTICRYCIAVLVFFKNYPCKYLLKYLLFL